MRTLKCLNGNSITHSIVYIDYCLKFNNIHEKQVALLSGYGHYRKLKQECIPVGCVLPAAVAVQGISTRHPPGPCPPGPCTPRGPCTPLGPCTTPPHPQTMHPWDHAPPDHAPPRTMHPHQDHAPPGPCTPQDHAPPRIMQPPSPHGQTHACKDITLPQTSFAGGNY